MRLRCTATMLVPHFSHEAITGMDSFDSSPDAIPRVWYDDGNLIIEAESSRFRIYKGLLADKSSFFSTMLSLPQDTSETLVDGCPIVHFQDSAQDVGIFLKAIYDPWYSHNTIPLTRTANLISEFY